MIIFRYLYLSLVCVISFANALCTSNTILKPKLFSKNILANIAPVLSATGNQMYCSGSSVKIVSSMSITDPDDAGIDAIYIQISFRGFASVALY